MAKPQFPALSLFLAATAGRNMTRPAYLAVAVGICVMVLLTVDPAYEAAHHWVDAVLWACLAFFVFEWVVRLRHAVKSERGLAYSFSFRGLVDAVAAVAIPAALVGGASPKSAWLLSVLWLLKLVPGIPGLRQLRRVMVLESGPLFSVLVIFLMVVFLASVAEHFLEREAQPQTFGSVPAALWWAAVTMTTVGYGDVVPVTIAGKIITSIAVVLGFAMIALPVAIISSAFAEEVKRRDFVVCERHERSTNEPVIEHSLQLQTGLGGGGSVVGDTHDRIEGRLAAPVGRIGLEAQEGLAQFLGARRPEVRFRRADEHAFHVRIIRRSIQADQGFHEGCSGEDGVDRIGGRLVRSAVTEIDLQHGVMGPRRLAGRDKRHDQDQRDENEEHHQRGQAAEEGEQEGSHAGSPPPHRGGGQGLTANRARRNRCVICLGFWGGSVPGRSSWIRTNDLLLPKQALYQAELYSDGAGPIAAFRRPRNARKGAANRRLCGAGTGLETALTASKQGRIRLLLSGRELSNSPPLPELGRRQVVRQRFLVPPFRGSNPCAPAREK